jgi:hypothetical protein
MDDESVMSGSEGSVLDPIVSIRCRFVLMPGETVTVRADLAAPGKAGTYTTRFALSGDQGAFCTLPLTLTVK